MAQTLVYLLRHAQTIPVEGVVNKEWELSDGGKGQASQLVKLLQDLDIDVVYSSPYIRALQTLEPYLEKSGKNAITDEAFVEIHAAQDYMDPIEFQELTRQMMEDVKHAELGAESVKKCQIRFMAGVNKVAKENLGKKILICSHGMPVAAALKAFDEKYGYEEWCQMKMPAVFKLVSDENGGRWDRDFELNL